MMLRKKEIRSEFVLLSIPTLVVYESKVLFLFRSIATSFLNVTSNSEISQQSIIAGEYNSEESDEFDDSDGDPTLCSRGD